MATQVLSKLIANTPKASWLGGTEWVKALIGSFAGTASSSSNEPAGNDTNTSAQPAGGSGWHNDKPAGASDSDNKQPDWNSADQPASGDPATGEEPADSPSDPYEKWYGRTDLSRDAHLAVLERDGSYGDKDHEIVSLLSRHPHFWIFN